MQATDVRLFAISTARSTRAGVAFSLERMMRIQPLLQFIRRRFARGVPYGLGFSIAFALVCMSLWGFLELVEAVTVEGDLEELDAAAHAVVFEFFGGSRNLGVAVTWFGNATTLTAFTILLTIALVFGRRYWAAFRVALASGVGAPVVLGLKSLFARARPLEQVVSAQGYSFPSGHAFASTVFYGMAAYLVWRMSKARWARVLALVLGPLMFLLVGMSRVYLNVHFITDVVGGWLSGFAWLGATIILVDVVESRTRSRREERQDKDSGGDGSDAGPPDAQASN